MAKNEFSLRKVFNAFAQKAGEDFPELKKEFAIYYAPEDTVYGHFDDDQEENLREIGHKFKDKAEATAIHPSYGGEGHYIINYIGQISDEKDPFVLQATLRHELGHLVAPRGTFADHHGFIFRETVADIFSMLYQPQGNDALQQRIEFASLNTAYWLIVQNDADHLSLPVLHELKRLSAIYDLQRMASTPLQAANMAYRMALLYVPPEEDAQKVANVFASTRRSYNRRIKLSPEAPFKKSVKAMFNAPGNISSLAFLTGLKFLEPNLNKRGRYWDSVRKKINERLQAENAEPPQQRYAHEARDMMVFGCFDRSADTRIDPDVYESKENMDYLDRAMKIYAMLRQQQAAGQYSSLNQNQVIALARKRAAAKLVNSNPPRKTPAAI